MRFHDERNKPAPPPPLPSMPYRIEMTVAGGYGVFRDHPVKVYADGRRDSASDDEAAVYRRITWLEGAIREAPTAVAPELPYRVELLTFGGLGVTRQHQVKIKPNDYSPAVLLTADEIAVNEYLQTLEAELRRVTIARELAPLDSPTIPPEVVASLTDPIDSAPESLTALNGATAEPAPERDVAELTSVTNPPTASGANDPDPPTANAVATSANADDKRGRAIAELLADPGASNGVLAERANCSDEFVRKLRKALEAEGKLQPVAVVTRRDGATYHLSANGADSPAEQGVGDTPAAPTQS